jgi:hydrogenase expression/formation protein HypD
LSRLGATLRSSEAVSRLARLASKLFEEVRRKLGLPKLKIMDFCGTHEWTVTHYGLRSLLPRGLELIAGPGCPVCVTPSRYIEEAIRLALDGVVVYTYGDTYRLPAVHPVRGARSLAEARSLGASVRLVYSLVEAARDAKSHGRLSVFVGIGFETAAPGYARLLALDKLPVNLKFLSLVKLTPPAMFYSLEVLREKPTDAPVMGVIAPGHVSTIVGGRAWIPVAEHFEIPVVVAGFEPLDVMAAIVEILRQLLRGEHRVVVEYTRAVRWEGSPEAQRLVYKVFQVVDDAWRGIGFLPKSGLRLRRSYRAYDAFEELGVKEVTPSTWRADNPPGCRCAEVVLGKAKPTDCPHFMRDCTPSKPYGPCMVSSEGTCAIWARFGGGGDAAELAKKLGLV